jgi:hypothetical protein
MGLLTEKYKAWAKHPEKYTAKQVLDQIVADLKWLEQEQAKNCNIQRVVFSEAEVCPVCKKSFEKGWGEFCSQDCWDTDM